MTEFETRAADWLSVGEALERVLAHAAPLSEEEVLPMEGLGRSLARSVQARATLPPWDNSAMDGYAVLEQDLTEAGPSRPVTLTVVGDIKAGEAVGRALEPGEAIRIMTGAPVPPAADAIVRVEDTDAEAEPGSVRVFFRPEPGNDIRPAGQDMRKGDEVLSAGTTIGSGQIGLLAAAGAEKVWVHRKPRVAILSTGDEVAPAQQYHRVLAGQAVPETNGPSLEAAVYGVFGTPLRLGVADDTPESILEKVSFAKESRADVLVTSGGASMGEHDLIKRTLEGEGFRLDFWRVKMRPGTPFSFGILKKSPEDPPLPVFGLPGNPASSFVTFQVFCRPFLLTLGGHRRVHRRVIQGRAGETLRSPTHLTHFFRVRFFGDPLSPLVVTTGSQTSGLVQGQGLAQGLAVVPEGVETIEKGEMVRVILLDDFAYGVDGPGFVPE